MTSLIQLAVFVCAALMLVAGLSACGEKMEGDVLTPVGVAAVRAGTLPISVTVDPSGKFAYVENSFNGTGGNSVSAYTIDATTGALTSVGAVAAGTNPRSVTVDPSGMFAYVTNLVSNDVSAYTINATNGVLTALGRVRARAGSASIAMAGGTAAVSYTPKFAYVANYFSGNVSAYTINAGTGALTSVGGKLSRLHHHHWHDSVARLVMLLGHAVG